MSTMKVTNLKHESSSVNNIVLNSDGSVGGELATTLASKLDLAGGKILQIVRATDSTNRSTTSTSYVDASLSVTITPQKSDSAILLLWTFSILGGTDAHYTQTRITDSSNNPVSGAERGLYRHARSSDSVMQLLIGYSTPATTSATTYKARFSNLDGTTSTLRNATDFTGQLYALEISA